MGSIALAAEKPVGGHAVFDGDGDYIEVSDSDDFYFGSNNFTVNFWINLDSLGSQYDAVIGQWGTSPNLGWIVSFDSLTGASSPPYDIISFWTTSTGSGANRVVNSITSDWINKWNFVSIVRRGSVTKLFVNGVEEDSGTSIDTYNSANALQMGGDTIAGGRYIHGALDEIEIHNGNALSDEEINQTYQRGLRGFKSNITEGLVAYYDFENNVTEDNTEYQDKSGESNDGTPNDDVYVTEHIGGYSIFDGGTNYIDIGPSSRYNSSSGTISLWIKPTDTTGSKHILGDRTANGDYIQLYLYTTDIFQARINSGTSYDIISPVSASPNQWHHIILTWGLQGFKLYQDGTMVDDDSYIGSWTSNSNMHLGGTINSFLKQNMDDVVFYDRQLSSTEISQIYERGKKGLENNITEGIVSHHKMDTNWKDSGPNGYHGTLYGDAFFTNISYARYFNISKPIGLNIHLEGDSIEIKKYNLTRVSFKGEGDIDISSLSLSTSPDKTVITGFDSAKGVEGTHSLYVNNTNGAGVYICPNANSLAEVSADCVGLVQINHTNCTQGDTLSGYTCTVEGSLYKVSGLTGSGVGESCLEDGDCTVGTCVNNICVDAQGNPVPEFHEWAMIVAIAITIGGLIVSRKQ